MKTIRHLSLIAGSVLVLAVMAVTIPSTLAQEATATPNPGIPTALPACVAYHVTANAANVRACAAPGCRIVAEVPRNTMLCVLGEADTPTWLQVDLAPEDPASPTFYISSGVVAPGAPSQSEEAAVNCQSFLVNTEQTTVYSCPQTNCRTLGTVKLEEWLCAQDYSADYPGWFYMTDSDPGLVGWVQRADLVPGQPNTNVRPTRTPGPPTWTPGPRTPTATFTPALPTVTPSGPITLEGLRPACQVYHVAVPQANVRACAGAGCEITGTVKQDEIVCIRGLTANPEWLIADLKPEDPAAPLYAVQVKDIAPGPAQPVSADCEPWEVIAEVDANARECPSLTCRVLGTVNRGDWVCAVAYGGAYEDWILADIPTGPKGVWISDQVLRRMNITGTPTNAPPSTPTNASSATQPPTPTPAAVTETLPALQSAQTPTLASIPVGAICLSYAVNVPGANVRSCPSTDCGIVAKLTQNTPVCVIGPAPFLEESWFVIDLDPADPNSPPVFMSQNLVRAVPSGPGTPIAPTNTPVTTTTPLGTPTEMPTPTPFVTLLPTPIFTPIPTQVPSTPLLAREVVISTLRVPNIELISPRGSNRFRFNLPDDWFMDGNSVLYLNLEYFETRPPAETGVPQVPLTATLDVHLDSDLISSVQLNNTVVGPQTLAIPLPPRLMSDQERRTHTIQLTLNAEDHCLLNSEARVFVRSDLSYFHFEFRETTPILDLARYPRPFYNQRFEDDPEAVLMVLPLDPTDNDLQTAGRIAAGLGFLTGKDLDIHIVTAEDITDEERKNNHLLLIGQIGTNPLIDQLYKDNLLPTTLDSAGKLAVQATPLNPTDGLVQLVINPQNPMRAVMTVTGQTPEALLKAAQALAGPPSIMGLGGPLALVTDTRPIVHLPGGSALQSDLTFTQLGYPEITLNGIGTLIAEMQFFMPLGQRLTADAYVDLLYNYSELLQTGKSTLALLLNDTTPIASEVLGGTVNSANATPVTASAPMNPNHLRAWIPSSGIIPGQMNKLTIILNIEGDWNCVPPDPAVVFFSISGDSLLHLPREIAEQVLVAPQVGWFPIPFNTLSDLSDVWISLPDQPTRAEYEQAFRFVAALGSAANGGEGFTPHVQVGGIPPGTDLSLYNFIVLGRPTINSFLRLLNDQLPQPFVPGTDELEQRLDDVSYRLPPGYEVGVLQTFTSPWSENHVVLVITGTGAQSQNWSAEALLGDQYGRSQLLGDVVFVSQNAVSAVDTHLIEQNVELLTRVPELETETALQSSATVTPETAHTVTPGPTLTPFPSMTPHPSGTPTPLYTRTPLPTVASPIPTFAPLSGAQIQPTESILPEWFDFLVLVTGIFVIFTLIVGLIHIIRRERRRVV